MPGKPGLELGDREVLRPNGNQTVENLLGFPVSARSGEGADHPEHRPRLIGLDVEKRAVLGDRPVEVPQLGQYRGQVEACRVQTCVERECLQVGLARLGQFALLLMSEACILERERLGVHEPPIN
ncbi:hypothetical protein D3C87_645970 [compost metagenome]